MNLIQWQQLMLALMRDRIVCCGIGIYSCTNAVCRTERGAGGNAVIPDNVTVIGFQAFSECSGLENIMVEENNVVYDSRNKVI